MRLPTGLLFPCIALAALAGCDSATAISGRSVDGGSADFDPVDAGPMTFPRGTLVPIPAATCVNGAVMIPLRLDVAAYSRTLDRVVVASTSHRALYIIDPEGCSARAVVLPRPALGI